MWLITYIKSSNENAPRYVETVSAPDYSNAYINFYLKNRQFIIVDIKKI